MTTGTRARNRHQIVRNSVILDREAVACIACRRQVLGKVDGFVAILVVNAHQLQVSIVGDLGVVVVKVARGRVVPLLIRRPKDRGVTTLARVQDKITVGRLHDKSHAVVKPNHFALAEAITVGERLLANVGPDFFLHVHRITVERSLEDVKNARVVNGHKVVADGTLVGVRRVVEVVATVRNKVAVALEPVHHASNMVAALALGVLIGVPATGIEAILRGPVSVARKANLARSVAVGGELAFVHLNNGWITAAHDHVHVGDVNAAAQGGAAEKESDC